MTRFNVRNYGARGDGATDDAKAIQAALDACRMAGGGIVDVPAGRYAHGRMLRIGANTTVQGEGIAVTLLRMKADSAIDWESSLVNQAWRNSAANLDMTPQDENIVLRDFTVDGNREQQRGNNRHTYGISLMRQKGARIERVMVRGTRVAAIKLVATDGAIVSGCRTRDIAGGNSVHVLDSQRFLVVDNIFEAPGDIGIEIQSGEYEPSSTRVFSYTGDGVVANNVVVGDPSITNYGIALRGYVHRDSNARDYPVRNVVVSSNLVRGCKLGGLQLLEKVEGCSLSGNSSVENAGDGLTVPVAPSGAIPRDCSVVGNTIRDNGQNGMWFDARVDSFMVANNFVLSNRRHGITGRFRNSDIINNIQRGNGVPAPATYDNIRVSPDSAAIPETGLGSIVGP